MRQLIGCLVLAAVLACGEAGVESDITKINEVIFSVGHTDINSVNGIIVSQSVDISGDEFDQYVDDVQNYVLNTIHYQIGDYENASSGDTDISITIRIDFDNTATAGDGDVLLNTTIDNLANSTDNVLLYTRASETNTGLADPNVVLSLEQAVLNRQSFIMEIEATRSGDDVSDDFTITFFLDITARVQLD